MPTVSQDDAETYQEMFLACAVEDVSEFIEDCAGDVETHFGDADGADEMADSMRKHADQLETLFDLLKHDMYTLDQLNRPVK